MTTIRFQEVSVSRQKSGKCPVCGKIAVRSKRFFMTISPFNKNPDGTIRTPDEVRAAVHKMADKWTPDFRHAKCIEGGEG